MQKRQRQDLAPLQLSQVDLGIPERNIPAPERQDPQLGIGRRTPPVTDRRGSSAQPTGGRDTAHPGRDCASPGSGPCLSSGLGRRDQPSPDQEGKGGLNLFAGAERILRLHLISKDMDITSRERGVLANLFGANLSPETI
jgi:hypothetical protein